MRTVSWMDINGVSVRSYFAGENGFFNSKSGILGDLKPLSSNEG